MKKREINLMRDIIQIACTRVYRTRILTARLKLANKSDLSSTVVVIIVFLYLFKMRDIEVRYQSLHVNKLLQSYLPCILHMFFLNFNPKRWDLDCKNFLYLLYKKCNRGVCRVRIPLPKQFLRNKDSSLHDIGN